MNEGEDIAEGAGSARTCDAFLGGRLAIVQSAGGFRAGLDSVLLGAAVRPGPGAVLDLGAGVGTAGLVALAHEADRSATLVDSDPQMVALAAANIASNGFADRGRALLLDVGARGAERVAAGLPTDHFRSVIANPPWFDPARGTAPAPARARARHMPPADLARWVKTALAHACPGGEVIFIHPAENLPVLLAQMQLKLGELTVLPLITRLDCPASRVLVRGVKGTRAPFRLLAPMTINRNLVASGPVEAILRGQAVLDW